MTNKNMAKTAMIAAVYTVLTLVLMNFGFGQIQIRVAEVLCILCVYKKEYIFPVTLGCFLSNLIGVMMGFDILGWIDIVFGTLATYISLVLMYHLRDVIWFKRPILAYLMPALINGIVIGSMLSYVLMPDQFLLGLLINGAYVAIGEIIAVVGLGILLEKPIAKIVAMLDK